MHEHSCMYFIVVLHLCTYFQLVSLMCQQVGKDCFNFSTSRVGQITQQEKKAETFFIVFGDFEIFHNLQIIFLK
jgi:hypothetical protein